MKIGIRSYKRPEHIRSHTLDFLEKSGVSLNNVTVFTPEEQHSEYKKYIGDIPIRPATVGSHKAYESMMNYYDEGEIVMFMDDDLLYSKSSYIEESGEQTDLHLPKILDYITEAIENGVPLVGVSRARNALFSRELKWAYQCYFTLSGTMFALRNDRRLIPKYSHCDDLQIMLNLMKHRIGVPIILNKVMSGFDAGKLSGGLREAEDRGAERCKDIIAEYGSDFMYKWFIREDGKVTKYYDDTECTFFTNIHGWGKQTKMGVAAQSLNEFEKFWDKPTLEAFF